MSRFLGTRSRRTEPDGESHRRVCLVERRRPGAGVDLARSSLRFSSRRRKMPRRRGPRRPRLVSLGSLRKLGGAQWLRAPVPRHPMTEPGPVCRCRSTRTDVRVGIHIGECVLNDAIPRVSPPTSAPASPPPPNRARSSEWASVCGSQSRCSATPDAAPGRTVERTRSRGHPLDAGHAGGHREVARPVGHLYRRPRDAAVSPASSGAVSADTLARALRSHEARERFQAKKPTSS